MKPLFIIGAPRSGTTFFTTAVNHHPKVLVTNELRAWNIIVQTSNRLARPSEVLPMHPVRDAYAKSVVSAMVDNLRGFYAEEVNKTNLACPTVQEPNGKNEILVFGDKNPGYADAHNVGCLDLMGASMPDSVFIHVHRDPRACVSSYLRVNVYPDDIDKAINIWLRHVETAIAFAADIGSGRVLDIRYEDIVSGGTAVEPVVRVGKLLGLEDVDPIISFLRGEEQNRTPYRSPATPVGQLGQSTFSDVLDDEQIEKVERRCAPLMERMGYQPARAL